MVIQNEHLIEKLKTSEATINVLESKVIRLTEKVEDLRRSKAEEAAVRKSLENAIQRRDIDIAEKEMEIHKLRKEANPHMD